MEKLSHKARTRQRILDEAAKVMRECGTESIGVASLMKRVGLTHGGFYAHFASRDVLVEAVIAQMFADSAQRLAAIVQIEDPAQRLNQLIDNYLSDVHRVTPGEGCPLPALASEMAHLPLEARTLFSQRREVVRQRLAQPLQQLGNPHADRLAASILAEMVGAMALARACPDDTEASHILADSRLSVKQRAGLVMV
ncbi:TetR/AcrR family transcriptional regulator [Erwiniaceae bacterium L1_54_6]|jgi:TetR/AcrR family transcriptional regulator, transcriptional repressor for nem operon|uniref:TetR family transcriptional regulator n=1 Tax=Pantoea cypripedii TaxID=55209 RepID=A0A6B9G000_PANCY|nr:TetR/AcrR family transcriptional regulator [Pantoea cypripedii]MDF7660144.1 TetR/AcrR family transcriptional regulator [Erwiniaceae bacterium L1_54_6]QGY30624.1 TetR family transcriptional regulator [Pantoea cypripedii]